MKRLNVSGTYKIKETVFQSLKMKVGIFSGDNPNSIVFKIFVVQNTNDIQVLENYYRK